MTWGMVAGAAITVVGGALASNSANKGARKAADAQTAAAQLTVDEQRREYDQTRTDQAPWLQAGSGALTKQNAFLNGDWSGFENSPDYKYALDQGLSAVDHGAAARGGLFGGGNSRDEMRFGQGLALQNADGYYSKLAGMSGTGIQTAQNLGALGAGMANNIGNAYTNAGNARASAYQQIGDNNAQMWGVAAGAGNRLAQSYYYNHKAGG